MQIQNAFFHSYYLEKKNYYSPIIIVEQNLTFFHKQIAKGKVEPK